MAFCADARDRIARVGRNRNAIKCNAEIVARGLKALVLLAMEPRKGGVTREEVGPTFE